MRQKIIGELRRLLTSKNNDAVKLAFLAGDDPKYIDGLDLRGLAELRRNANGTVEIKLLDRLKALELLDRLSQQQDEGQLDSFLDQIRREQP